MSTIGEFRLSADDAGLSVAFDRAPDARVELDGSISRSLPDLWVTNVDRTAIERAFDADPSVETYEYIVDVGDRLLYDLSFDDRTESVFDELLGGGGSLLEMSGERGWWRIEMRFRNREDLCRTHDLLAASGVNADVLRVTGVSESSPDRTGLTEEQREALAAAFQRGYFEIPRDISMEELARELDISHQALSERLRRGYERLVDEKLEPIRDGA